MSSLILGPLIGGLSHESVNLWARADGPATLYAWLAEEGKKLRMVGKASLEAQNGFAGIVHVSGLKPETRYCYALTLDETPPPVRDTRSFTTFPLPGTPRSFSFAFGSCFRPKRESGGEAFRELGERINRDQLRFALLIGDQIYADAHRYNGLGRVAVTVEEYRHVYQHVWSHPAWRSAMERLPVFMTLDDHEVDNDWHWIDEARTQADLPLYTKIERLLKSRPPEERRLSGRRVREALKAYWEHQGMHAPPMLHFPRRDERVRFLLDREDSGSLAYTFTYGAAAFFVMDTRTGRLLNRRTRQMLHPAQWQALEAWLLEVKDAYPVKFLVTSSAFLYDLWVDVPDRWSAFPQERDRLLHFLAAHGIEEVYFLSGDLHSAHATRAWLYGPQGKRILICEFCSSPFEQESNRLSVFFHRPPRSAAIARFEHLFTIGQHNFGIVHVDFSTSPPSVRFECVYKKGGEWESHRIECSSF